MTNATQNWENASGEVTGIPQWYALTVKHQHEFPAQIALRLKGHETLLPTYRARREWSDRTVERELPLFSGYVFCRFPHRERATVLDTPGVGRIVGFGGNHTPVAEQEIAAIQTIMASKVAAHPWPYLRAGDRVRVARGPLRGLEGTLAEENDGARLVVSVELLGRSIAVRMEPDLVAPARLYRSAGA